VNKGALESVVEDLLSIPPLMRRNIQRKLVRTAFARIEDISLPHFEIMKTLEESGTAHIVEIGKKLQIPKPQMTHLVDRLERLEMVERQPDESDRRSFNLTLTEKGCRTLEEHDRIIKNSIKQKLSCLTGDELRELSVSLRKLRDILSKLQ
jgi:DNA-binding MarR family transcriptional regulator